MIWRIFFIDLLGGQLDGICKIRFTIKIYLLVSQLQFLFLNVKILFLCTCVTLLAHRFGCFIPFYLELALSIYIFIVIGCFILFYISSKGQHSAKKKYFYGYNQIDMDFPFYYSSAFCRELEWTWNSINYLSWDFFIFLKNLTSCLVDNTVSFSENND